jgi:hypothetical protein
MRQEVESERLPMKNTHWVPMACFEQHHKDAIKSWFSPLCDDMTPESAEVWEDRRTGRTKKARAKMVDKDGKRFTAIRRHTKAGVTVELKAAA